MELGLIILAVAVVVAAAIFAFARPKAASTASSDPRLDTVLQGQATIAEQFRGAAAAQAALTAQMDALREKMGEGLAASAQKTGETFATITERLNVIDAAQKNISELSGHVVSLKAIFSDKQARGALAQDQMEAIVAEHLSPDQYEFQATLSNNSRPDCVIRIPNVAARIVVDSKFPLGAFEALRAAENEEQRKAAMVAVRGDIQAHVREIRKYLLPGEVQTPIIMFVPSDSIYAELHAGFPETLRKARQDQVVIVSPHVFMLVIVTIQGLMRDARMRERADTIKQEVGLLLNDVRLLGERVEKLQRHFSQAEGDIKDILTSTGKITSRAEKIEKVELAPTDAPKELG
jgi:DNA recombination protein RmuC